MLEKLLSEILKDWYIYSGLMIFFSIPMIMFFNLRSQVTEEDLELFKKMNSRR